jgi:hypothetical protein
VTLYAIDPGTEQSAVVTMVDGSIYSAVIWPNADVLERLEEGAYGPTHLVIEHIQSYGMPVGREIFDTVFWSGRFAQAWEKAAGQKWTLLSRRDVKLHICGSPQAKDANIRQALIDRYGGKVATKKGGPLYGIRSHLWAALALAVTYQDTALNGGQE